ncbi:RICIN domain-containing protein [Chitinolyticbacter albus]|uniref:RICIN domain-containing protein n=1 Tax=Chitinolyticbacter albus TaxID=2961951 RepID=UPI00210A32E2|nr:RICIN domain-containing protein [Chitinolyticbacter albus]
MKSALIALSFALGLPAAQGLDYGPVADALQASTSSQFANTNPVFYKQNNGSASNSGNFNYWWNAHALDTLVDAYQRTRDPAYPPRLKALLQGIRSKNGNTYRNTYYDDMEWLGLASLRAHELTGDNEYLQVAEELWGYIKGGYSSGLFSWNSDCAPACKNTIASTPAIILGARLYGLRGGAADLALIQEAYGNVRRLQVDPASGAVWDSVSLVTGEANKARYSYNQGMYIGAGLELYKLTGNRAYLDDALKTANWALTGFTQNGMLFAGESGSGDGGLFKGILVRYLALLAREGALAAADRSRINDAIRYNAHILHSKGLLRPNMLAGANWSAQPGTVIDSSVQLAGLILFETAAVLDYPTFYQHYNYNGRATALPPGRYTTADLSARGIANNDVTSLTVAPGWSVVLYDGDNFTGASITRSSNDNLLNNAGFNDRASSILILPPAESPGLTVYQNCDFTGYGVTLPGGDFNLARLQGEGLVDNDLSSLRVTTGYRAWFYQDDNYGGAAYVSTSSDNCLVDNGYNDNISSLKLKADGYTGLAGKYYLKNGYSSLYMDVYDGSMANGGRVIQWTYSGGANQQFEFSHQGNGVYVIRNAKSGKALDVTDVSPADGTPLQQWDYSNNANARFIAYPVGGSSYQLIPIHSGKSLRVGNGNAGSNVEQWSNDNQNTSYWQLIPVGTSPTPVPTPLPTPVPTPQPTVQPSTPTPTPPGTSCSVASWSSAAIYTGGQRVSYAGHLYEAKWWTQGEQPNLSGQWGVWKDLGACN